MHVQDAENTGPQGAKSPAAAQVPSASDGRLPLVALQTNSPSLGPGRASLQASPELSWHPDELVESMCRLVRHQRAGNMVCD